MKVINLYGGPSTGKSTTAAGLFYKMKSAGYKVELVTEYAKDLTYDKRHTILKNQEYVFAKQFSRLRRLKDQVDYVITDSPSLLQLVYLSDEFELPSLKNVIIEGHDYFDTVDIFLKRNLENHPYQEYGRNQTQEEAIEIDDKILKVLKGIDTLFHVVEVSDKAVDDIFNLIKE
jgi:molybdopterin-guanine dinucleotide biosynthesis protein